MFSNSNSFQANGGSMSTKPQQRETWAFTCRDMIPRSWGGGTR